MNGDAGLWMMIAVAAVALLSYIARTAWVEHLENNEAERQLERSRLRALAVQYDLPWSEETST